MGRTALVLGTLRTLLPRSDRVIAIDRAERHVFPPSLLWLMVGEGLCFIEAGGGRRF